MLLAQPITLRPFPVAHSARDHQPQRVPTPSQHGRVAGPNLPNATIASCAAKDERDWHANVPCTD